MPIHIPIGSFLSYYAIKMVLLSGATKKIFRVLTTNVLSVLKSVTPDENDADDFNFMLSRLEVSDFMRKQVDGDNRVIPYQLYWYELNKIMENAKEYIPFLNERDETGITGAQKVLSVFEFRVPYYVGPL